MATQPPADNPGDTPAEFPTPGNDPGVPGGPEEAPPRGRITISQTTPPRNFRRPIDGVGAAICR
ncbi:hypothetical protein ACFSHP_07440 [Novosphingobium panipatense]